MENLFNFVVSLPEKMAGFGQWLFTALPGLNIAPIAIFGISGFSALIALKITRLVVGG